MDWDIVREGGTTGVLFVALGILYREFHRVVRQRDKLFELLIRSIQSGHKTAAVAEELALRQDDDR